MCPIYFVPEQSSQPLTRQCISQLTDQRTLSFFRGAGTEAWLLSSLSLSPTELICRGSAHQINRPHQPRFPRCLGPLCPFPERRSHSSLSCSGCGSVQSGAAEPKANSAAFSTIWSHDMLASWTLCTVLVVLPPPHLKKDIVEIGGSSEKSNKEGQRYTVVCTQEAAESPRILQPGK